MGGTTLTALPADQVHMWTRLLWHNFMLNAYSRLPHNIYSKQYCPILIKENTHILTYIPTPHMYTCAHIHGGET